MAPSHLPPSAPGQDRASREAWIGLRLRVWLTCISGGVVAGLGTLYVMGTQVKAGGIEPSVLLAWLSGVAFAAVLVGIVLAAWLDHHVVGHLRGLLRGMYSGRVIELRGLPAATGWGELSELTDAAQELLAHQRQSARAAGELEAMRAQLAGLTASLRLWLRAEHWESPDLPAGPLTELAETLSRALSRRAVVDEQNAHVARQVAGELAAALSDAQESAEQAERGFVEATAMLTTVRELQRLSGELQGALGSLAAPAAPEGGGEAAREVLEALVVASQESVDAIGRGMLRVQDVSDQVQQLGNRATLVAIHALTAGRTDAQGEDLGAELKQLALDVRELTERTGRFTLDIETAVAEAGAHMRAAREQAASRLGEVPAPHATSARALDDANRLLERVREMVQDAARKGERLSAAGERASRAAERLSRRVHEEAGEAQALVVRMTPVGGDEPAAAGPLRLLDGDGDEGADAVAPAGQEPASETDVAADAPRGEEAP